ncbi:hypothetical protein C8R44DRAFT_858941 [Mycena epipterygia]|nr:hypothetical protein C8R44DRAFT_858941 [Mycena epipterygia]
MPHPHTVTDICLDSIIACLNLTVTLLNELTGAFGTPFLQAISSTTFSLITSVKNVKRNKEECIQLMENIHRILNAIIDLHIKSETAGSLPPAILNHVGKFTETLHKIHTFVEAQHNTNRIKHFFRQNEMTSLGKDCQAGVKDAMKVFKVVTDPTIAANIAEMQKKTHDMHQELLEMVGSLSNDSCSDKSSSPKIFHGREAELEQIITILAQQSARIAILGAGGIGKSSLAKAALYHSDVVAKYEHRFFIAADPASTSIELAALIRSHLGLKPAKDLIKAVIQFLSKGPPCLLVLDNLETPWEPFKSRNGVEEFLSLLTDIPHLALIITMRGAERPSKVRWTHPFLEPLQPLSYDAARQTFVEIADDFHHSEDIDRILHLTDNMPLAVDLIAHLVDYEGCSNVLARWETEKTSLLSTGYDKQSSLDASIIMSLASPRMTPGAKDLLSLLSILPDGLSDIVLIQSGLPVQDLMGCRTTLLRTSLAYFDDKQRLKALVPIREYIYSSSPPSSSLFDPLSKHFHSMLSSHRKCTGFAENNTANQITSNLGNLHRLLQLELYSENPHLADVIDCIVVVNNFRKMMGQGGFELMNSIPAVFPQPCDHQMEAKYIAGLFSSVGDQPIANAELLIQQGMAHFNHFNDPALECNFYIGVGRYYHYFDHNISAAAQSYEKALSLARFCARQHDACCAALLQLAQVKSSIEAIALNVELKCLLRMGNLKETLVLGHRARELLHLCGMQGSHTDLDVMSCLAQVHLLKSEYLDAHKIHTELAQKTSPKQSPFHNAYALLNIAEVDIMIGADAAVVQQNLDSAKMMFSSLRLVEIVNQCEMILANLNLREGNIKAAKDLLKQCLMKSLGNNAQSVSYCLERLADVGCWTSANINWSYTWTVIYLVQAQKTQERLARYKALQFLGDVFLSEGDEHTADNLFVVALEGFTYMDVHRSRADCMLRLGDIAKNRGDLVKAVELWKQARPLFERSSQAKDMAQIDTRLALVDQATLETHQRTLAHLSELEAPTILLDELSTQEVGSEGQKIMPVQY